MKAYELLDSPGKWCKGALAKNSSGEFVLVVSEHAVRFCALGAITRVYSRSVDYWNRKRLLESRVRALGYGSVEEWNDAPDRTFEEVHGLLKSLDI